MRRGLWIIKGRVCYYGKSLFRKTAERNRLSVLKQSLPERPGYPARERLSDFGKT
jgi:hypothetical protein